MRPLAVPLDAHTETGPLIHQQHLDREPAYIEIELRHWWFPRSTLRTEVALEISTVYWVEKFWPELAIMTADKTLAKLAQQLYNRPSLMMDSSLRHRLHRIQIQQPARGVSCRPIEPGRQSVFLWTASESCPPDS